MTQIAQPAIGILEEPCFSHRSEDGEDILGSSFRLIAELPNGQRFEHATVAYSPRSTYGEDEGETRVWQDFAGARAQIAQLQSEMLANGPLSIETILASPEWHEIDPAYGSEAYQEQGIEFLRMQQERRSSGMGM